MYDHIVLDYGHGGLDEDGHYTTAPGKMFRHENGEVAYEGVLNRQIGGIVRSFLRAHEPELKIVTTVDADDPRDIDLSYRVRVANQFDPQRTLFVSIHSNASESHQGTGFEIFTTRGVTASDDLATKIGERIEPFYDSLELRLRFDFSDSDLDKEVDFYVLRKTRCPAVLLECLFFDHWEDFQHLRDVGFQKELAWCIYRGILDFVDARA